MVTLAGVEPATCGLGNRRSIHLSYRAKPVISITYSYFIKRLLLLWDFCKGLWLVSRNQSLRIVRCNWLTDSILCSRKIEPPCNKGLHILTRNLAEDRARYRFAA